MAESLHYYILHCYRLVCDQKNGCGLKWKCVSFEKNLITVENAYKDVTKLLSDNEKFLHDMANALLEEETIDAKAVDNLYKYGTTKAPETEEPKATLEAAGIVVPEVVEANEHTSTVEAPSETPSNESK